MRRLVAIVAICFCLSACRPAVRTPLGPTPFKTSAPAPTRTSAPGPTHTSAPAPTRTSAPTVAPQPSRTSALPARWDWREHGVVTPVRDQGECGACYAFAMLGNIESKLLIDTGQSFDLSEEHAKECTWEELSDYEDETGFLGSCDGGDFLILANLFSQHGIALESCAPYEDGDSGFAACSCPPAKTLLGWSYGYDEFGADTQRLKRLLYENGPLATSLYAGDGDDWDDEWQDYDGSYTLCYPGVELENHSVLLVGWDDGLEHACGRGGWIVKDSQGSAWGGTCGYGEEGGYFTVAYGSARIGREYAFLSEWQDAEPREELWFFDEAGWNDSLGYDSTETWTLSVFVPTHDAWATRVEFWTTEATREVVVYLYDGFDGDAVQGLLFQSAPRAYPDSGYYSLPIKPALALTEGDDLVVVVKFVNQDDEYPIPLDSLGPTRTERTYCSDTGEDGTWEDATEYAAEVAVRLRTRASAP